MSDPFGSGDVGLGSGRDSPRGGAGGRSPAAATASSSSGPRNQLQNTQQKVDEVVNIMRVNVEKVLERDQKLSDLDNRADALRHGASQFEQQAGKLKRKYWWNNIKMMIIIGLVVLFLIIIIIITVYSKYSGGDDTTATTTPPPPAASA